VEPVSAEVDGRPAALLDVTLETGRTHQIRVHAQTLGFPVLGDRKYGESESEGEGEGEQSEGEEPGEPSDTGPARLYLHADRLRFVHPHTREVVDLRAPLPAWARAREDE
jgi:23S rRNA-/tRNA-specific pseudouridylate synthase